MQSSNQVLPNGSYMLRSVEWNTFMFAGTGTDSSGDHWVWVGGAKNINNNKELFYFEYIRDYNTYRIFSSAWKGPLFCGDATDRTGDHWAWVNKDPNYNRETSKCLWRVVQRPDGRYQIYSVKHGGALFAGDSKDKDNDHWCWISKNADYNQRNKHVWEIVPCT